MVSAPALWATEGLERLPSCNKPVWGGKRHKKRAALQRLLSNIWLGKRRGELKSTTFLESLMHMEWGSQHCTNPTGASRRQPGDILWIFSWGHLCLEVSRAQLARMGKAAQSASVLKAGRGEGRNPRARRLDAYSRPHASFSKGISEWWGEKQS